MADWKYIMRASVVGVVILLSGIGIVAARQSGGAAGPLNAVARLQSLQPEGARTQVMVVATFHLGQLEKRFRPEMLDRVVAALETFKPDAICIESLSGPRVHELELRRNAGPLYAEVLDGFGARHLSLGRTALDMLHTTPSAAFNQVRELHAQGGAARAGTSPEARARLALLMLAAYEPDSALLQWSYLNDAQRAAQTPVPAEVAKLLNDNLAKVNEVPALAVQLARRLGLQKLEPVDDFEDLDAFPAFMSQMDKDFKGNALLAAVSKSAVYKDADRKMEECVAKGDLMPQYLLMNSRGYAVADVEAQWGVFLKTHFASGSDRSRLGLWENRNLKIAARIRAVAALHPGGRILVIYGAAHKPFLDAYLSNMSDLKVVQVVQLVKS